MIAADDAPDGFVYAPFDQFRHDLKTPLTTIHARAQLLERAIRRAPSLRAEEQTRMLAGVVAIECAVREMVALVDRMDSVGDGATKGSQPPRA